MAGAPVPIPATEKETKILCIADLKETASKKLPQSARGNQLNSLSEHISIPTSN